MRCWPRVTGAYGLSRSTAGASPTPPIPRWRQQLQTSSAAAEPLDAVEGRDENDERTIDLQPGQITMLEPGEEVQTSAPADVGQTYEPFKYRTLLQVSAALDVP